MQKVWRWPWSLEVGRGGLASYATAFNETGNKADESQVKCTRFDVRVLIGRVVLNWVLVVMKEKRIEKTYKTRGYISAIQSHLSWSFVNVWKKIYNLIQQHTFDRVVFNSLFVITIAKNLWRFGEIIILIATF